MTDNKGCPILRQRYENKGNTINLVIEAKNLSSEKHSIFFQNKSINLEDIGAKLIKRDLGTGYHIKEGIFISNKNYCNTLDSKLFKNDKNLDICDFFNMTLNTKCEDNE